MTLSQAPRKRYVRCDRRIRGEDEDREMKFLLAPIIGLALFALIVGAGIAVAWALGWVILRIQPMDPVWTPFKIGVDCFDCLIVAFGLTWVGLMFLRPRHRQLEGK
jgi:hypothetical protein